VCATDATDRDAHGLGSAAVDVDEVHPDGVVGQCTEDGSKRRRGPAPTADDLAQIIGVDPNLDQLPTTLLAGSYRHVIWPVDDTTDQVFEGLGEHVQLSRSVSAADAASASPPLVSAVPAGSFCVVAPWAPCSLLSWELACLALLCLVAFFFGGVVASVLG